ncbi:hypothetical protein GCM10022251_29460 [Phytohabitans flavus]|uniref:Uncharacterized protein n=1 Tax=Phytohabitans flavus TaxID=1076124 RepID=A0A6F8XNM9_9ACTN|nr:hypothetical protein [Phytohabitans flavus]BCB75426.1 hypothetical protein Pflav_018360 [Phytohabitans flavus]
MSKEQEEYEQALATYRRIKALSDEHWHALDATCRAMDNQTWVGPAGRKFGKGVHDHRAELWRQLTSAVNAADRDLNTKRAIARAAEKKK